jgi:hypothetical protein
MKNIIKIIVVLAFGFGMYACTDDFAEMNKNPTQPTQTVPDYLFNNIIRTTGYSGSYILYLYNPQTYNMTRLGTASQTSSPDDMYNLPQTSGIDASWSVFYGKLRDIAELYKNIDAASGAPERYVNQKNMLAIYKAQILFHTCDKFGDIPYFDAGKGLSDLVFRPKYDNQGEIYEAVIAELKEAVSTMDMDGETAAGESVFDFDINNLVWRGDGTAVAHFEKWKKLGTSLILKYALRMSKANEASAKAHINWALSNGLLMDNREDGAAIIPYRIDGWENASRKNAHQWSFYYNPTFRPGQFLASKLATPADPELIDSTEVFDVRFYALHYPNTAGEYKLLANSPDDNAGKDISGRDTEVYPGGEWTRTMAHWTETTTQYSAWNRCYPMSMFQPNWMLSYAEHNFVMAEIYASGMGPAVNHAMAEQYYNAGITSSIEDLLQYEHVNYPDDNPNIYIQYTQADIDAVINHPMNKYDAANALDQIRTQRWIDYFARPDEAWSLMRRTNLFDVDNTVPLVAGGSNVEMVYRVKYPGSEINYNTSMYQEQLSKMGGQDDIFYKSWLWE